MLYVQPTRLLRRGQQGPSQCRAEGRGRHQLEISVGVGQCGWKRLGETVRLSVYMQYDPHVQQVIDEQLEVECNMASRMGRVVETSQLDIQHSSVPVTAVQSFGVATSILSEEEDLERRGSRGPRLSDLLQIQVRNDLTRSRMRRLGYRVVCQCPPRTRSKLSVII